MLSRGKGKTNFPNPQSLALMGTWGSYNLYPSNFTSRDFVKKFGLSFNICSNTMSKFIMIETCNVDDRV